MRRLSLSWDKLRPESFENVCDPPRTSLPAQVKVLCARSRPLEGRCQVRSSSPTRASRRLFVPQLGAFRVFRRTPSCYSTARNRSQIPSIRPRSFSHPDRQQPHCLQTLRQPFHLRRRQQTEAIRWGRDFEPPLLLHFPVHTRRVKPNQPASLVPASTRTTPTGTPTDKRHQN